MKTKCSKCMDYIVCYQDSKLDRENCPDYHYDFLLSQPEEKKPEYDNTIPLIDENTEVPWE